MFIKKLIIGILSFYFFNTSKNCSNRADLLKSSVVITFSIEKKRVKLRFSQKRKWKKRTYFKQKVLKLKGANPKDNRFSNQRRLRRMFRNC